MTVAELKKQLDNYDDDTIVVVRGYEGGVDEISEIQTGFCTEPDPKKEWYYGKLHFSEGQNPDCHRRAIWLKK